MYLFNCLLPSINAFADPGFKWTSLVFIWLGLPSFKTSQSIHYLVFVHQRYLTLLKALKRDQIFVGKLSHSITFIVVFILFKKFRPLINLFDIIRIWMASRRGWWRTVVIKNGGEKPCDSVLSIITPDNKNRWDKMLHGSGSNSGNSRVECSVWF